MSHNSHQITTTMTTPTVMSGQCQHETEFPVEMFRKHIQCILKLARLQDVYIQTLTNPENLKHYITAFTHSSIDRENNYEWYEMMGDAILNKCMVSYINHRFPFLHNQDGVKVIARLKINLVSKKMFSDISTKLQFPKFIRFVGYQVLMSRYNASSSTGSHDIPKINTRSLYEDVLEAFFGATEWLMDRHFEFGTGHVVCYRILQSIMDTIPISLCYEDLYDNITRLKETFDLLKPQLWGQIKYENSRVDDMQHVRIYQFCHQTHRKVLLYECTGTLLDETKQAGAGEVIRLLKQQGFEKPVPPYYIHLRDKMKMC